MMTGIAAMHVEHAKALEVQVRACAEGLPRWCGVRGVSRFRGGGRQKQKESMWGSPRASLEQLKTKGGGGGQNPLPPSPDQSDHSGKKRNLQ